MARKEVKIDLKDGQEPAIVAEHSQLLSMPIEVLHRIMFFVHKDLDYDEGFRLLSLCKALLPANMRGFYNDIVLNSSDQTRLFAECIVRDLSVARHVVSLEYNKPEAECSTKRQLNKVRKADSISYLQRHHEREVAAHTWASISLVLPFMAALTFLRLDLTHLLNLPTFSANVIYRLLSQMARLKQLHLITDFKADGEGSYMQTLDIYDCLAGCARAGARLRRFAFGLPVSTESLDGGLWLINPAWREVIADLREAELPITLAPILFVQFLGAVKAMRKLTLYWEGESIDSFLLSSALARTAHSLRELSIVAPDDRQPTPAVADVLFEQLLPSLTALRFLELDATPMTNALQHTCNSIRTLLFRSFHGDFPYDTLISQLGDGRWPKLRSIKLVDVEFDPAEWQYLQDVCSARGIALANLTLEEDEEADDEEYSSQGENGDDSDEGA